jgi:uncharacterized protein (TIGR03437 family)
VLRGLPLLLLVSEAFGGTVQPLPALPPATFVTAIQVDSSGYIYIAGESYPGVPSSSTGHAFVGKLSPDGSQTIWWTKLAGSSNDNAQAIALGSDDSVYVTGTTQSQDFPTTSGAMQTATSALVQAFAAKLDPAGAVIYSTYIGGTADTAGVAIAVDSSGRAFITGGMLTSGTFPTSPGAVTGATVDNGTAFIIELNAAGSAAPVGIVGFGGSAIAVDAQDNIYAVGGFQGGLPTTPGAFQTTGSTAICANGPGGVGPSRCPMQHVVKINPAGTQLIFATYLGGLYGAEPSSIAIDADGNVIVAGATNSPDYPTTPAAYQPEYFGNPVPGTGFPFGPSAPIPAGYVSKLNASGSALVWSTLFAGSGAGEGITALRVDPTGNILFAGHASSADTPGLWSTPVASRPNGSYQGFVARLSADGTTLSPVQLIPSSVNATGIAVRNDGSVVFAGYGSQFTNAVASQVLAAVTLSSVGHVAAICDTADNAKIVSVAPGQLLTLFGTGLDGGTVSFNGIPAPVLYTSDIQINVQVPYEIAGMTEVAMQVSPVSESYTLAVIARQPSVFLSASAFTQPVFDSAACNGQNFSGLQPLALNADGTQNSCDNPAAPGSTVTIFLNGLGLTTPAPSTGAVSSAAIAITPAANAGTSVLSTATLPGSIESIAQVQIPVSLNWAFMLQVQTFLTRGPGILIWVRPAS